MDTTGRLVAALAVLALLAARPGRRSKFQVSIPADGESVKIDGLASGPVTLPIARSGSGARHSDGRTTFWSKGGEATLERVGESPRTCTAVADPAAVPGSRWRLVRLESSDGTTAVPADPSRYTLEFGADGAATGQADTSNRSSRWCRGGSWPTVWRSP